MTPSATDAPTGLDRPDDMPAAFVAAWMARDAAALARLFAPDADFVNVTGLHWRDRAAIERAHAYALGSFFAGTTLAVRRTSVRALGPDAAVVHARMRLTGQTGPDGTPSGPRTTEFVFVLARTPAETETRWHCVAAQNTEVVPGAETFEATPDGLTPRDYRQT